MTDVFVLASNCSTLKKKNAEQNEVKVKIAGFNLRVFVLRLQGTYNEAYLPIQYANISSQNNTT